MKSGVVFRLVFLVFILCLLVLGVQFARLQSWRSSRLVDLYSTSEVAATKSGPIEFVREGEGPAVLVLHDASGGFDQGATLGSFLVEAGFQIIAPSRPGYLRTPLKTGATPGEQADALADLIDTLGTPQVAVLGFGWAGPVALEFARRHPQKTTALVLVGAVMDRIDPSIPPLPFPPVREFGATGDFKSWRYSLLTENNPTRALHTAFSIAFHDNPAAVEPLATGILADPVRLALFRSLALAHSPVSPRELGFLNDQAQIRSLPATPWTTILAPVFFVHGGLDRSAPLTFIEAAKTQLPLAASLILPSEGHLVLLGNDAASVGEQITAFLKKNTASHGK